MFVAFKRRAVRTLIACGAALAAAMAVLPAAVGQAASISIGLGDMVVLQQPTSGAGGREVYVVNAAGTTKTLVGTYGASVNTWDVAFENNGNILVVANDNLYRIDPSNYDATQTGTAIAVTTIVGGNPTNLTNMRGVAVGSTGAIYLSTEQPASVRGHHRLTGSGASYTSTLVGTTSASQNWHLAVHTDAPGAAVLLGLDNNNLYKFKEATSDREQLNLISGALGTGRYSVAYDAAANMAYVGAHNSNTIASVNTETNAVVSNVITGTNPLGGVRGLAFANGKLYAANHVNGSGLYTIDVSTGAATQLGSVTFGAPRAIDVYTIPEPSSFALLGASLLGLTALGRRGRTSRKA